MKLRLLFAILCAVSGQGTSWGAESDPYTYTDEILNPHRLVIVGLTLGNNWSGLETNIAADLNPQNQYEKLDVELPLYVSWIFDTSSSSGCYPFPCQINPPQPITSFPWFSGHHAEFRVVNIEQDLSSDSEYKACAEGAGLEAPTTLSYPLTADGKLRVTDIHGGFGTRTTIHLRLCVSAQDCEDQFELAVGWNKPGRHYDDYLGSEVDRAPGTVYNRAFDVEINGGSILRGYIPVRIVDWISTDIGVTSGTDSPSPRYVDAADVAYWYAKCNPELGHQVRWGFPGETPPNNPTFQCNVSPWSDYIDGSDLSGFFGDVGKSCSLGKVGDAEFAAILEWFGVAPTGRMVADGPNNENLLPEYEVVDWEKNRRAVADPYGYRTQQNSATAKEAPWGLIKQLYR